MTILKNRLPINRILLLICLILPTVGFTKNDSKQFQVIFGDFFTNDRVTIMFNNLKIVDNCILTSDSCVGLTKLMIKGQLTDKHVIVLHNGKRFKCRATNNIFDISIVMNGNRFSFPIDLGKGRFINISKNNSGGLRLTQNVRASEYD